MLASGRLEEARTSLVFGEDHTNANYPGFNLGYLKLNIRAAEIALGTGDPTFALARANLALAHLAERSDPDMLPYLQAAAFKVRGDALLATNDNAAVNAFDTALALQRRLQDPASPWLANTLISAGLAHQKIGDRDRGADLMREARRIARQQRVAFHVLQNTLIGALASKKLRFGSLLRRVAYYLVQAPFTLPGRRYQRLRPCAIH